MIKQTFFLTVLLSTAFVYGDFKLPKIFNRVVDKVKEKLQSKPHSDVEPTDEEIEKMEELVNKTIEELREEKKLSKKEAFLQTCIELLPCLNSDDFTEGEKAALHKLIGKLMKKVN